MQRYNSGGFPYGYFVDKNSCTLSHNKSEIKILNIIFRKAINGYGMVKIASYLNDHNFLTRYGKLWSNITISEKLSDKRLLFYLGYKNGEKGNWAPILDKNTYSLIIANKSGITKPIRLTKYSDNLFTGTNLLKCGYCGAPMKVCTMQNRNKSLYYSYYICSSRHIKGKSTCPESKLLHYNLYNKLCLSDIHFTLHNFKFSDAISNKVKERFNTLLNRLSKHIGDLEYFNVAESELRSLNESLTINVPNTITDKELAVLVCKDILFYNETIKITYKIPTNLKLDYYKSIKTNGNK